MTAAQGTTGRTVATAPLSVTVAILTFRRPADLDEALPRLVEQVRGAEGATLLVVDNDTVPSAQGVVDRHRAAAPGLVRYVHEPRPGIAAARNAALDAAGTDLVVFVDDDERPSARWLVTLLEAFERFGGAGVVGPVVSELDGELDPWIVAGRFFERLRHPTGTRVTVAATNNLLLDLRLVDAWGARFDEEFGLSGGSDTVLTLTLAKHGGVLTWCDEAVVIDVVPRARATRGWVLRRAFRTGNSRSRAAVHVADGPFRAAAERLGWFVRGSVRCVAGSLRAGAGWLVRRPDHAARGTRTLVRGAGMVLGAVGVIYREYRRA